MSKLANVNKDVSAIHQEHEFASDIEVASKKKKGPGCSPSTNTEGSVIHHEAVVDEAVVDEPVLNDEDDEKILDSYRHLAENTGGTKDKKKRVHLKDVLQKRFVYEKPKDQPAAIIESSDSGDQEEQDQKYDDENQPEVQSAGNFDLKGLIQQDDDDTTTDLDSDWDTIQLKNNFLEDFDAMPELSDISIGSEEEETYETYTQLKAVKSEIDEEEKDIGYFVDPLTGEILTSRETTTEESEIIQVEEEHDTSQLSDIDIIEVDDFIEVVDSEDQLQIIATMPAINVVQEDALNMTAILRQRENQYIVESFLQEIFKSVVRTAETADSKTKRICNLDKMKLLIELNKIVNEYVVEKNMNFSLTTKVSDHYKRSKSFRALSKLTRGENEKESERYYQSLIYLDHIRKVLAETKTKNALLMSSVLMDLYYIQNITMSSEIEFEERVRSTLIRKDSEYMKRVVERELRLIRNLRNQISDTRLFLLTRQHTLGRLHAHILKCEQINDTISLTSFINIQNEVQTLDKKVEEKNNDLKKQHHICQGELHNICHTREKIKMIKIRLQKAQAIYKEKAELTTKLREELYKYKLERLNIKKLYQEQSFKGGLLAIPGLMLDYDDTVDKLIVKRATVEKLRETFHHLTSRIKIVEKAYQELNLT